MKILKIVKEVVIRSVLVLLGLMLGSIGFYGFDELVTNFFDPNGSGVYIMLVMAILFLLVALYASGRRSKGKK